MGISAEARGAFLNPPRRPFTGRHLISLSQRVPGYPWPIASCDRR